MLEPRDELSSRQWTFHPETYTGAVRIAPLLSHAVAEEDPQKIIRTIRGALGMSRAEFARALGWSPSTIARWELGRAKPSRLALKIILAYGEERRVRYRRASARVTQLPALIEHPLHHSGAAELRQARATAGAPLNAWRPAPEARPAWTGGDRSRWEAELNLRVAFGRDPSGFQGSRRSWARRAIVVGAIVGAVLVVASPLMMTGKPSPATRRAPSAYRTRAMTQGATAAEPPRLARAYDAPRTDTVEVPAKPTPRMAELEGVTLLGRRREAVFRTPTETVSVAEGERLGRQSAARIGADGVELRDPTGEIHTVGLGDRIPID